MQFDIFFSISQTPVGGHTPSEAEMFRSFFRQVQAADAAGYGTAWIAEAHLSTTVQQQHKDAVVPHWRGEIGLNTDVFQLAHQIFARTKRIEVGAAVMNLLCNGGPVARAEQTAAFASLHGLDPAETRRLRLGFSAGRFEFMSRAYGFVPRDALEEVAWPVVKGQHFAEAVEVYLRLLNGEALAGDDTQPRFLRREQFRSDADWARVQAVAAGLGLPTDVIPLRRRYAFDVLRIMPREWRQELIDLILGSHEPALQDFANTLRPVKVFNLSITRPAVIEETHARLTRTFHPDGGPWQRIHMPRTVMVFLNQQPGLSAEARCAAAREEAAAALGAYWTALEGTLDPRKVADATDNAVIGDADAVAAQIVERFHPDDALMLWFDFFNHDCDRVIANIAAFMSEVRPRVEALLAARSAP